MTVFSPMYVSSSYLKGSLSKLIEWLTTAMISMHFFLMLYDDSYMVAVYDLYDRKAIVISHRPFYISS